MKITKQEYNKIMVAIKRHLIFKKNIVVDDGNFYFLVKKINHKKFTVIARKSGVAVFENYYNYDNNNIVSLSLIFIAMFGIAILPLIINLILK